MKQKSTKKRFSSFATLLTVIVLIAVVLLNAVTMLLSDRFNLKLDLTPTSAYTLTQETKKILSEVDKDIKITVLSEESSFICGGGASLDPYYSQANTVINLIASQKPNISVSYVDLDKNPNFKSEYPNYTLASDDVLVECDKKVVHIKTIDLFNTTSTTLGTLTITSSKAEEAIISAIMVATAEKLPKVTVLQGYDEFSADVLANLLIANAYEVDSLSLIATESIPADTDMAIICGPKRDFSNADLDKLENFLYNSGQYGKTLLYFADTEQQALPNLEGFLKEWGIEVQRGTAFETNQDRIISSNVFYTVCNYAQNDLTKEVSERNLFPTLPYCRPLKATFTQSGIRSVQSLIQFTAQSGIYPEGVTGWQPTKEDITGNIDGMMISTAKPVAEDTKGSHVVVCGTVNFINAEIVSGNVFGNGEFMVSLTNSLVKSGTDFGITPKRVGNGYLTIATSDQNILFGLFVVALPLAILISGLVIYLRRRHL